VNSESTRRSAEAQAQRAGVIAVSAASQLTPSEEALAAAARALDAELWDEAEQLLVDYAKRVDDRRGEIKALNEETETLARQGWWRRYTPAGRARARSLRLRAEELRQAADSEKKDYQRRYAELREKISRRQSQRLADGWRNAALSLGGLWVVQAVLLLFGSHVTNHTHGLLRGRGSNLPLAGHRGIRGNRRDGTLAIGPCMGLLADAIACDTGGRRHDGVPVGACLRTQYVRDACRRNRRTRVHGDGGARHGCDDEGLSGSSPERGLKRAAGAA
jgi:hypothetical protein